MKNVAQFLALDVGGTYLKAALYRPARRAEGALPLEEAGRARLPSRVAEGKLTDAIVEAAAQLGATAENVAGIGVSTAGIVDYAGKKVVSAAPHLKSLCSETWREELERRFNAPCAMINDADSAMIAARALNIVKPEDDLALLAVGTGLGCAVIRQLHRIRVGRMLPLLGSVRTPVGGYDQIAGAVNFADGGDLATKLAKGGEEAARYLDDLADIAATCGILYNVDKLLLTGGLAQAAARADFDLQSELAARLAAPTPELRRPIKVLTCAEPLSLIGAGLLAEGVAGQGEKLPPPASGSATEEPLFGDMELTDLPAEKLARLMFEAENRAAQDFASALPGIARAAELAARALADGGRLILVGAGTSGRLAAVDAVELPCTYGIAEHQAVALIAGGNCEAALTIESDNEEDASSVPELLLAAPTEKDVVVGISASGGAFFATSAVNFANHRGAKTVMIQESPLPRTPATVTIPLATGAELVAGSTRMKAGTATKKALNFLTTAAMIKLGRTRNSRMVNMRVLNEKLRRRAEKMAALPKKI